ncbi:MAG: hypothetical protein AAGJ31_04570, partial [Verrucomicrobiota bacterium]
MRALSPVSFSARSRRRTWFLSALCGWLLGVGAVSQTQVVSLNDVAQSLGLVTYNTNAPGEPVTITQEGAPLELLRPAVSVEERIGLDGQPLLGAEPLLQGAFVDAFDLRLRVHALDLEEGGIQVSRRFASVDWNSRSGLRPGEDPSEVFGPGWNTSLAPSIRFEQPTEGDIDQ